MKDRMNQNNYYFLINSLEWWWAERVIINFADTLVKQWKNIYVIALKSANFYDLPKWIQYISLSNVKSNLLMFLLIPWYVWKFKKTIKKYDLSLWMSSLEVANFVHILAKKNARIAFETNISYFSHWIVSFSFRFLIRWLYPKASKIKVNSEENKYDLAKYLQINENRIDVIYNPIDIEKIKEKMDETISNDLKQKSIGKKIFVTVGRLIKSKNYWTIIRSFKHIYDVIGKDFIYLILWDWPEKKKLEKQVIDSWLENNILLIGVQKNVFKYLNVADYFVYASQVEWFPNVLIEAMACNLPIVTSDFKTWAKECILWEYKKHDHAHLKYPYYWPNWVLLDLDNYKNNFVESYKNLYKIRQEKKWFEKFNIETLSKYILEFIS